MVKSGSKYFLRINTREEIFSKLDLIFKDQKVEREYFWELTIDEDSPHFNDALVYLTNLVSVNIEKLENLKISKDEITIWLFFEYESQCNMEFHPYQLKKLIELDSVFCISCWEKY